MPIFTGKEKALIGSVIAALIGVVNIVLPFFTDATLVHYISTGVAIVGAVGAYFGVYQTTNSLPSEHGTDAPATVDVPADQTPDTTTPTV